MKHKTEDQIAELIKRFPIIGLIRFAERSGKQKLPKTNVHIQRADAGTMHLQARNCRYNGRAYIAREDNLRGTKSEYLIAVGCDGKPITYLEWERGDFEKMSKDIFEKVSPGEVNYLVWVTVINWYTPSSEKREEKTGENLFDEFVEGEVDIIIFQKAKNQTFAELIKIADEQKQKRENAHKYLPEKMPEFPSIHKGLESGGKIHAFRSGGGLRVVYMRCDGEGDNLGYGEHPHIEDALNYLEEDLIAGGREYSDVYGKLYPHYLTGESVATSNLDLWILQGHTFDCWVEGSAVIFVLKGIVETKTPKDVMRRVKEIGFGEQILWNKRGFVYATSLYRFPNGDVGQSTHLIQAPKDKEENEAFHYRISKTGIGQTFWDAVASAFEAPEVEI